MAHNQNTASFEKMLPRSSRWEIANIYGHNMFVEFISPIFLPYVKKKIKEAKLFDKWLHRGFLTNRMK